MPNTNQATQTINTDTTQQQATQQTIQQPTQGLQPIQETLNQLNLFNYSQKIKNLQTVTNFVSPSALQNIIQTKVAINSLYNVLGMLDCFISTQPRLRLSKEQKKAIIKKINIQDYRPTVTEYEVINNHINYLKEKSKTNLSTLPDTFKRVLHYFSQEDIALQDINCIIKYCLLPDLNTVVDSTNLTYFFNSEIARELLASRTSNSSFYNPSTSSSILTLREGASEPRAVIIDGYITTDLSEFEFTDSANKERIYSTLSSKYSNCIHKYSYTNTKTSEGITMSGYIKTLKATADLEEELEDTLEERVKQESLNNPTLRLIPVKFNQKASTFTPIKPDYTEIIRNSCSGGSGSNMYTIGDDSFTQVISLDNRTCELFTKEQFSRIDRLYSDKEEDILAIKNLMKELLCGMCDELFDLESLCGIQSKKRLEDLLKDKEIRRFKTTQEEAIYFSNGNRINTINTPINSSTSNPTSFSICIRINPINSSTSNSTSSSTSSGSSRARSVDRWYTAYPSTLSFDSSLISTEPTIEAFREHYMVADEDAFSPTQPTSPNTSPSPQSEPVELTEEDLVYNPYTDPRRTSHNNYTAQSYYSGRYNMLAQDTLNAQIIQNNQATPTPSTQPYTVENMREIINAFSLPRDFTDEQIESLVDQVNAYTGNNNNPLSTQDMLSALSRSCRTANIFASAGVDNLNDENHRSNSSGFYPTSYTF